jgi:hypothetical protein
MQKLEKQAARNGKVCDRSEPYHDGRAAGSHCGRMGTAKTA